MAGRQSQGFTLIEVLLATAITALVTVLAYSGISAAITAAESHEEQAQRLVDVQLALRVFEQDIRHVRLRGIRDEYGDDRPAMEQGDYPLQLTRAGWDNPREQRRSTLQRIRYRLEDDVLWREHWLVLDRVEEDSDLQQLQLLKGVESLTLEFLDQKAPAAASSPLGGEWIEQWPGAHGSDYLPRAVRLTLDIEYFGQVMRVVEIVSEQ